MNVWVLLGAAVAGGVGAGLRYVVDVVVAGGRPGRSLLGIFVVNVTGSLALGLLTGAGADVIGSEAGWILGVGLLGGYTTFSTVALDSVLLLRGAQARRGWLNAGGNLLVGVTAAAVGLALGALL